MNIFSVGIPKTLFRAVLYFKYSKTVMMIKLVLSKIIISNNNNVSREVNIYAKKLHI